MLQQRAQSGCTYLDKANLSHLFLLVFHRRIDLNNIKSNLERIVQLQFGSIFMEILPCVRSRIGLAKGKFRKFLNKHRIDCWNALLPFKRRILGTFGDEETIPDEFNWSKEVLNLREAIRWSQARKMNEFLEIAKLRNFLRSVYATFNLNFYVLLLFVLFFLSSYSVSIFSFKYIVDRVDAGMQMIKLDNFLFLNMYEQREGSCARCNSNDYDDNTGLMF